ncbi:hypothetical protein [Chryseosolibacter indicus]|uniref:Uncharacterized protein n=1 Tax=Chryseosolibacter indicus TaxID=2782351 RepID=A0ABS5VRF4_9BACT|nr:hypothetical protein [Chryseosolibacter indicus]MBT1704012.1 hypothetical protein [Chryseosolibacter indicus]
MENKNVSKKALRTLLNDSMRDAIGRLQLPEPSKKVKKLINKSSKRIAVEFADILKKENKKAKQTAKTLTYVEDVLKGKKEKKDKRFKKKELKAAEA